MGDRRSWKSWKKAIQEGKTISSKTVAREDGINVTSKKGTNQGKTHGGLRIVVKGDVTKRLGGGRPSPYTGTSVKERVKT